MADLAVFVSVCVEKAKKALEELDRVLGTPERNMQILGSFYENNAVIDVAKTPREQLEGILNQYSNVAHYEVDQDYDRLIAYATTTVGGRVIMLRKDICVRFIGVRGIEEFAREFVDQFAYGVAAKIREKATALTDPTAIEIEEFTTASPSEFDIEL